MSEHTAGPWHIGAARNHDLAIVQLNDRDEAVEIAYVPYRYHQSETEANAHLIAAAPELLALCGMALDLLLTDGYGETSHPVMRLRAAVAKARGQAQ